MESTLYALLVGINDYPTKPLQGCLTDQQSLETFLQWYQPDPTRLHLKTLTNEEATRDGVIEGFSHFKSAGPNDVCLFYFAGHGSFTTAPVGFNSPTNRFHQSLVCWDSRRTGGRDLMDKELGYLIWKYSSGLHKVAPRFVVITDSCHSGSVTRELAETLSGSLQERTLEPMMPVEATEYYGFNEEVNGQHGYVVSQEGGHERIQVQTGPHIHLAATRDNQTAKENQVDGQVRGLFTYSLLKALQESKGLIGYSELIRRTELQLKTFVTDQNPLLSVEALPSETARDQFLQRDALPFQRTNWVYFNAQRGWCIDVGSLLGASAHDEILLENGLRTKITEVFPEESAIFEKPGLEHDKRYKATLIPQQITKFALAPTLPLTAKTLLEGVDTTGLPLLFVTDTDQQARFRIQATNNLVYASGLADSKPLFKGRSLETKADAGLFLEDLQMFCTWNQLLALQNPASTLTDRDVKITATVAVTAPAPDYDPTTFEEVADLAKPIGLYYFNDASPALQITIENRSDRELWFQPFYLGFDYSISNSSLKAFSLEAGDTANLTYTYRGKPTDVIRLMVDKKYRDLGYTEVIEYLKLIVSTQPLETGVLDQYRQDGLNLAPRSERDVAQTEKATNRGPDVGIEEFAKEWITTTLAFQISYPAKGASIAAGGRYESPGIRIQVPAGFETRFAWSSSGEVKRSLGELTPPNR
ncbi:hypothetical protein GO730_20300 [Spirosoma sp. HMF3257]|uniref:Peptidase C14 caspase domain-containing protein n=1 Tax=Spirosoma telluris TaxID=2183553 RepID=A0A327NKK7_9BACT|nr:hypothetical protein [Spirosoma telluris]RAI75910.1 hypothetical protein HMF3257_20225 [Spirosoma telluris]